MSILVFKNEHKTTYKAIKYISLLNVKFGPLKAQGCFFRTAQWIVKKLWKPPRVESRVKTNNLIHTSFKQMIKTIGQLSDCKSNQSLNFSL